MFYSLDRILIVVAAVVVLNGCASVAPRPPLDWKSETVESIRRLDAHRPQLQIIITYDPTYSTHTALRLATTNNEALFWDPAGRYAETDDGSYDSHVERINDLVIKNAPTLEGYWQSSVNASDIAMEVFEWNLGATETAAVRHALLEGAGLEPTNNGFRTKTEKPFCTLAVSQFLSEHQNGPVSLGDRYFLPHSLARALYDANPDRVIVFRRDRETTVYMAPRPRIARKGS